MAALTYAAAYNKGWKTSQGPTIDLDRAEIRFLTKYGLDEAMCNAWMDGYLDYATARPKWHLRDCKGCVDHPENFPAKD